MRSLRFRIAFAYVVLIIASVTVLGLALAHDQETRLRRSLDRQLDVQAELVAESTGPLLAADGGTGGIDPLVKRLGQEAGTRVTVIALDGGVVGDSEMIPASSKITVSARRCCRR